MTTKDGGFLPAHSVSGPRTGPWTVHPLKALQYSRGTNMEAVTKVKPVSVV